MVQILVHVRPADSAKGEHFELIDCTLDTTILDVKNQVARLGLESGAFALPAESQELVFMEERCEDTKTLREYGINKDFIVQVAGFVVNPSKPGKRFVDGVLVSCG